MVIDIYGANGNRYIDLSTLSPLLTHPKYRPIHNIDLSTILSFSMELLTPGLVYFQPLILHESLICQTSCKSPYLDCIWPNLFNEVLHLILSHVNLWYFFLLTLNLHGSIDYENFSQSIFFILNDHSFSVIYETWFYGT